MWLKKGWSDRMLYYTTLALAGLGMALNIKLAYELVFPAPPEQSEDVGDD